MTILALLITGELIPEKRVAIKSWYSTVTRGPLVGLAKVY